jgi:transcriptional regulator with XRE-family HTH domain
MEPEESIAERLRATREERGYSTEQLAARAVVSRDAVLAIESGRARHPRLPTIAALASALNVSPSWLMDGVAVPGTDRLILSGLARPAPPVAAQPASADARAPLERYRTLINDYELRGWSVLAYAETPPAATLRRDSRPTPPPGSPPGTAPLGRPMSICREVRLGPGDELLDSVVR